MRKACYNCVNAVIHLSRCKKDLVYQGGKVEIDCPEFEPFYIPSSNYKEVKQETFKNPLEEFGFVLGTTVNNGVFKY